MLFMDFGYKDITKFAIVGYKKGKNFANRTIPHAFFLKKTKKCL